MTAPSVKLNFGRDGQGYNAFAPAPSNNMFSVQLTSGSNATLTLPTSSPYWIAAYSVTPGSEIWVAYNTTAAAPSSGTWASTNSELLPGARIIPSTNTTSSGTVATTINVLNNGSSTANIWIGLYASS
jgi:hypothetical protein